jgi:hypothetical protein
MKKQVSACAAALACVLVASVSAAVSVPGVVFKLEVKATGQPATTLTASIDGANLKMDIPQPGGAGAAVIFRGAEKEMVMVDHGRKSYVVMDQATMKNLTGQMSAAMKQMEAQMKNMPPEQRAMMEQMMKGRGMMPPGAQSAPTELRRTSERGKHSGYDAVKYEAVQGGKVKRVLWVTEWSSVAGASEARQAFESMAAFSEDLMSGLGPMAQNLTQNGFQDLKTLNGFPVLTIEYDDAGTVVSETRLVSATTETVPADAFTPPAGYTRDSIGR